MGYFRSMEKPLILITNDDGITAPGIRALVEACQGLGDLVVVAPDSPQSGMGHAITITKPLRVYASKVFDEPVVSYQCSGTPADCVKLSKDKILHRMPDLVVSGINHGSNASINVIYSGTMSAAVEAAIEGIPAIGFSLLDFSMEADFSFCIPYVRKLITETLQNGLPKGTLLNVNFPKTPTFKGVKICRQAIAKWEEEFDERRDPNGRQYFWLTGKFVNYDQGTDTDEWALANDYISVVPVTYDLTAYSAFAHLNNWNLTP